MFIWTLLIGVRALPIAYNANGIDYWQTNDTVPVPTPNNTFGILSSEQKQAISSEWGFDLDNRRARLQNLAAGSSPALLAAQSSVPPELVPLTISKPTPGAVGNAFENNNIQGITEFLYQGDIQLTEAQLADLEAQQAAPTSRKKRQVRSATSSRWPNNVLYYYLDPSINARKQTSIGQAISLLQQKTCLQFVNNPTATNRVRIYSGTGCFSSVGMVGGQQDTSLGDGCEAMGTAVHELMHSLGVYHMQMRSDRDYYVNISLAAVPSQYRGNFAKVNFGDIVQPAYTPFEFGSVMQYAANSFTNPTNNLSIIPSDTRFAYSMGTTRVSFYDIKMINDAYNCSANCNPINSANCQNGGLPNPNNCSTCNCPSGYSGDLCDQRPMADNSPTLCGSTFNASANWTNFGFTVGNGSSTSTRDVYTTCTFWIYAPAGMQVQIQYTNMWNEQCNYGCLWAGVEFKTDWDQRRRNPTVCCTNFMNQIFQSSLNPAPVIGFNRYYYSVFNFQYRYVPAPPKPPVPNSCGNTLPTSTCLANQAEGFCTNTNYTFQTRKYSCATTCGFCGVTAQPCVDTYSQCSIALCKQMDAMSNEYFCAQTCGYCNYPN